MSDVIGTVLEPMQLVLTKGRDFKWSFQNLNDAGVPTNFPGGSLYFEFALSPLVTWPFTISGNTATLKVESNAVDQIPNRTRWQLVFRATAEVAGGDPLARGFVTIQE